MAVNVGDTVQVGYTGVVTSINLKGTFVRIKREDGANLSIRNTYVTVIEPTYTPEAIYVDPFGTYYMRTYGDDWILCSTGMKVPHIGPARPLKKLVPES